jgi:hypothetical protein
VIQRRYCITKGKLVGKISDKIEEIVKGWRTKEAHEKAGNPPFEAVPSVKSTMAQVRDESHGELYRERKAILRGITKGNVPDSAILKRLAEIDLALGISEADTEHDLNVLKRLADNESNLAGYDDLMSKLHAEQVELTSEVKRLRDAWQEACRKHNQVTGEIRVRSAAKAQLEQLKSSNPRLFCDDVELLMDKPRLKAFYRECAADRSGPVAFYK